MPPAKKRPAAGRIELPAEAVRYRTQVKAWVYNSLNP